MNVVSLTQANLESRRAKLGVCHINENIWCRKSENLRLQKTLLEVDEKIQLFKSNIESKIDPANKDVQSKRKEELQLFLANEFIGI